VKLKAKLWVQAQIRLCDGLNVPVAVLRSGDPDAGAVLVKIAQSQDGWQVLSRIRDLDGNLAWFAGSGAAPVPEAEAEAYIARQAARDPDLWVLEIDGRRGGYDRAYLDL